MTDIFITELGTTPRDHDVSENQPAGNKTTRHVYVYNADDENAAIAAIRSDPKYTTAVVDNQTLTISGFSQAERIAPRKFLIDIEYSSEDEQDKELDIGSFRVSFDTTGGTTNRKLSIKTIESGASGHFLGYDFGIHPKTPTDFKKSIGVSSDGEVSGVEIPNPVFKFEITKRIENATITLAWIRSVKNLIGKTNSESYLGHEKGELLFLGIVGGNEVKVTTEETTQSTEVTFRFSSGENIHGLELGSDLPPVTRKGAWEYLWFFFEEQPLYDEEGTVVALLPVATQWFLEQVFEEGDYTILGIDESQYSNN